MKRWILILALVFGGCDCGGDIDPMDTSVDASTGMDATTGMDAMLADADAGQMSAELCDNGVDDDGDGDIDCADLDCVPSGVGEAEGRFEELVRWIHQAGAGASCAAPQLEVTPGFIEDARVSVLRGEVQDEAGAPLGGVRVEALNVPEYGHTFTRADGSFYFAINGGARVVLRMSSDGRLPAFRSEDRIETHRWVWLEDVALVPRGEVAGTATLGGGVQTVTGPTVTDDDGTRALTAVFSAGTGARAVLADGSEMPLSTLSIRMTEFTEGEFGEARMPAELPPASAYTYAIDISVDEAEALGASEVRFDRPVSLFLDNFLDLPVGTEVPVGFLAPDRADWIPERDGLVIEVLGVDAGLAQLDLDGDGNAEDQTRLDTEGITRDDLEHLAGRDGQTVWWVQTEHFSSFDLNLSFLLPDDIEFPNLLDAFLDLFDADSCSLGSVIQIENQVLGEGAALPGAMSNLLYMSSRTPGFGRAYTIDVPLTDDTPPDSLVAVKVEFEVGGVRVRERIDAGANLRFQYTWDGVGARGVRPFGARPFDLRIGYVYRANYSRSMDTGERGISFGRAGRGRISTNRTRTRITVWTERTGLVGTIDARRLGLGGFMLLDEHYYDVTGDTVHFGDGRKRSQSQSDALIEGVAGGGTVEDYEGANADEILLSGLTDVAVGPSGDIYAAISSANRILRIDRNGIVSVFAGTGVDEFSGDGGPATAAGIQGPASIAFGPDGSLYLSSQRRTFQGASQRIRRITPDGIINTIAGNGTLGNAGDGGPAVDAELNDPNNLAVAQDGTVYFSSNLAELRAVLPDGTMANISGLPGGRAEEGTPLAEARLGVIRSLHIDRGGRLYIGSENTVWRTDRDGRLRRIAGGNGFPLDLADQGNGRDARDAKVDTPDSIITDRNYNVYLGSTTYVRRIDRRGTISRVAGRVSGASMGDGGPAVNATLVGAVGLAFDRDGFLLFADPFPGSRIRRVRQSLSIRTDAGYLVADPGDGMVYLFGTNGRHLKTYHALTGAELIDFARLPSGRLDSMRDHGGRTTQVLRDTDETLTGFEGPFGLVTETTVGRNGWLSAVATADGANETFEISDDGLLTGHVDRRGATKTYVFDASGLLTSATAGTRTQELIPSSTPNSRAVTHRSASGQETTFSREASTVDGDSLFVRTVESPSGVATRTVHRAGETEATAADGTQRTSAVTGDPRFGLGQPRPASVTIDTPSGLSQSRTFTYDITRGTDVLTPDSLTREETDTRGSYTVSYDRAARQITRTFPSGRTTVETLDEVGRVINREAGGLRMVSYSYDEGRVISMSFDGPDGALAVDFAYGASNGLVETITDRDGSVISFGRDAIGRVTSITRGARTIGMTYDTAGDLTSVTPPGRQPYEFAYDSFGRLVEYRAPAVGGVTPVTNYAYDANGAPSSISLPSGRSIGFNLDAFGRAADIAVARGSFTTTYDAATGQIDGMSSPDGIALAWTYDGSLVTEETWSGAVTGSYAVTYGDQLRVATETVDDTVVTHDYDVDGLVSQAGPVVVSRGPARADITSQTIDTVVASYAYAASGELESITYTQAGAPLATFAYGRDAIGRIDREDETVEAASVGTSFGYDEHWQLLSAQRDGGDETTYRYDENGNRIEVLSAGASQETATYDARDRLINAGGRTYGFNTDDQLESMTDGVDTTVYAYDELGQLTSVTLPSGTVIDYLIDPQGRRAGRRVDGTLDKTWIYRGVVPIAEIDPGTGEETVFVYASDSSVPDAMLRGGTTYAFVKDLRGSVRLVVDAASGTVTQRIDYDAHGLVIADSSPGFQPFGYAGGLYDPDTGLVRMGVRDYDARTGRFTTPDPALFRGGSNLFLYAGNSPLSNVDRQGSFAGPAGCLLGAALNGGFELASILSSDSCESPAKRFSRVAVQASLGCISGFLGAWIPGEMGILGKLFLNVLIGAGENALGQFLSNGFDRAFSGKPGDLSNGVVSAAVLGGATGALGVLFDVGADKAISNAASPDGPLIREAKNPIDAVWARSQTVAQYEANADVLTVVGEFLSNTLESVGGSAWTYPDD